MSDNFVKIEIQTIRSRRKLPQHGAERPNEEMRLATDELGKCKDAQYSCGQWISVLCRQCSQTRALACPAFLRLMNCAEFLNSLIRLNRQSYLPNRHLTMPLLLLHVGGCGLRISEAGSFAYPTREKNGRETICSDMSATLAEEECEK